VAAIGSHLELRTDEDRADFLLSGTAVISVNLFRGDRRTIPLHRPGVIESRSEVHSWIAPAWVIITPTPLAAVSCADGRFTIADVPPGNYELVLWHEGVEGALPIKRRVPVMVNDGAGVSLEWDLPDGK
jgi:hypothetical protein